MLQWKCKIVTYHNDNEKWYYYIINSQKFYFYTGQTCCDKTAHIWLLRNYLAMCHKCIFSWQNYLHTMPDLIDVQNNYQFLPSGIMVSNLINWWSTYPKSAKAFSSFTISKVMSFIVSPMMLNSTTKETTINCYFVHNHIKIRIAKLYL